jgi:hypothetical protein
MNSVIQSVDGEMLHKMITNILIFLDTWNLVYRRILTIDWKEVKKWKCIQEKVDPKRKFLKEEDLVKP